MNMSYCVIDPMKIETELRESSAYWARSNIPRSAMELAAADCIGRLRLCPMLDEVIGACQGVKSEIAVRNYDDPEWAPSPYAQSQLDACDECMAAIRALTS